MRAKILMAFLPFLLCSSPALTQEQAGETATRVNLDHGISFTLPIGWIEDKQEASDTRKGEGGRLYRAFSCQTEICRRHTQEICRVTLFARNYSDGSTDSEAFTALYADPGSRYARLRAVRIATSEDAEFRRLLAPMKIGPRDWWVVETDARHNMKSGLFADTIIDGWRLRFSCKTCERGEDRHRSAMAILESVGVERD